MAEKRELTHCIEGSGGRQEGSKRSNEPEALKTKDSQGSSVGTHGQHWEAWKTAGSCGVGKRRTVPMVSAGKHGRLQRAVV